MKVTDVVTSTDALLCLQLIQDKDKIIEARKKATVLHYEFYCGRCHKRTDEATGGVLLIGLCWNCIEAIAGILVK